jgi:hypothetical protein
MGRLKVKDGKQFLAYLKRDTIRMMNVLANNNKMSNSAYLDWIIEKNFKTLNPREEIINLKKDIEMFKNQLTAISEQIEYKNKRLQELQNTSELYSSHKDLIEQNYQKKKKDFVNILIRKFKEESDINEIREMAKNHSMIMDNRFSAEELIIEAMSKLQIPKQIKKNETTTK